MFNIGAKARPLSSGGINVDSLAEAAADNSLKFTSFGQGGAFLLYLKFINENKF